MPTYVDPAGLKSISASGGNGAGGDGKRHRYTLSVTGAADCPSCKQPAYVYGEAGLRYCQACAYEPPESAARPVPPPDDNHDADPPDSKPALYEVVQNRPHRDDVVGSAAAIGNDALAAAQALHERIVRTEGKLVEARAELSRLVEMARTAGLPIPGDLEQAAPRRASAWKRHEQVVSCPDCGRICGSPAGLSIHRKTKHNHIKDAT